MSQNANQNTQSDSGPSTLQKSPSQSSICSTMSNVADLLPQEVGKQQITDNKYNISNVLKHIYQIKYFQKSNQIPAAVTNTPNTANSGASGETNSTGGTSKQFWMPDDQVKECFECNDKFTTFRRRHVTEI